VALASLSQYIDTTAPLSDKASGQAPSTKYAVRILSWPLHLLIALQGNYKFIIGTSQYVGKFKSVIQSRFGVSTIV
jgi:hypothetical protein